MALDFNKLRLDDLQIKGYRLYQDTAGYMFGIDAVLLADFAAKQCRSKDNVIDLCTGNGVIPLLLYGRNDSLCITGVEIQHGAAELAAYNIKLNRLENAIQIVEADLKTLHKSFYAQYDVVSVNPPYTPIGEGIANPNAARFEARHEVHATLADIIDASAKLIKGAGKLCMIHKAHRIGEIVVLLRQYKLEAKTIRFVHSHADDPAALVLLSAQKGAKCRTDVLAPVVIYNEDNSYSAQIDEIYRRTL